MTAIHATDLPDWSLLAKRRGAECYRDAFCAEVAGSVPLERFIASFYSSAVFWPERMALHLIGRGASHADIAALAEGRSELFAAWSVEAREPTQLLLRDFRDSTCSWLAVEPLDAGVTRLWFGSGLRHPEAPLVRAFTPTHRWYSRRLLAGAVRGVVRSRP